MSRLTISLEPRLARQLDHLVVDGGYANRSAAVREMIRFGLDRADLLGLTALDDQRSCVAHVSFLCPHRDPMVVARLARLLHTHRALVKGSSRIPLDDEHLLEIVILAGLTGAVRTCAEEIFGLKGVNSGNVRISAVDDARAQPGGPAAPLPVESMPSLRTEKESQ